MNSTMYDSFEILILDYSDGRMHMDTETSTSKNKRIK